MPGAKQTIAESLTKLARASGRRLSVKYLKKKKTSYINNLQHCRELLQFMIKHCVALHFD